MKNQKVSEKYRLSFENEELFNFKLLSALNKHEKTVEVLDS